LVVVGRRFGEMGRDSAPTNAAPAVGASALPIYHHRATILQSIREHRVTHIQGETGCGKSTQVPKYILEDAEAMRREGRGDGRTKIVVTQPRRMAAVTLARRVAEELHEDLGRTVGYKISGDCVEGKLCFVTVGFLLQVLVNQPTEFETYSHVILDEVHERSVDADLLSMLMKLLMQCNTKVKLIVMSATLQARLFAEYFFCVESQGRRTARLNPVPIFVGARTHPVEEIFLDEIEDHFNISGGLARMGIDKALMGFSGVRKGGKGKGKHKGKGMDKTCEGSAGKASGFRRLEPQITDGFDELCKELVQQMAREMCTLIVFLPGIADITAFYEVLLPLDTARADHGNWRSDDEWRQPSGGAMGSSTAVPLRIYPMHSLIPREEQEEVFHAPPKGICHVVLASNIAESSLTLPSVCGIIDLAMRRSIQYDARRLMSCLVTTWCSQSSCKQRAGRAGRTMPGRAVRLVTRDFFELEMVEFDPPEMLNAPLTKLYLQAKQLCYKLDNMYDRGLIPDEIDMDLSTPTLLLGEVVQPPATMLVEAAIAELADVGCLDNPTEHALITPLGYLAMALPCELRLCRLLYMGLVLQCPCDAIAMVAGLTAADPFSTPSLLVLKDQREYTRKLERSFSARLWCDQRRHSEPLMLWAIFAEWIQAGAPRGSRMGGFARDWSVIPKKFEALACEAVDLCTRILKLLSPRSPGHVAVQRLLGTMRFQVDRREELVKAQYPADAEYGRLFSEDVGLLRALLCAGFSDQLLVHLKPRWAPGGGKKKTKEEVMVDIMKKQGLSYTGTVCILNPPQELRTWGDCEESEENYQRLCISMCGEQARRVHWDEKEKLLFFDFKAPGQSPAAETTRRWRSSRGQAHRQTQHQETERDRPPEEVLEDVCPPVHRMHQFGAGRWKFSVESALGPGGGDADTEAAPRGDHRMMEILKPLQPFLLNWEVIQHAGQCTSGEGSASKKGGGPPKRLAPVKALPDWRNPLGFACHASGTLPAEEHLAVCASIQGLESGASAFVAGTTVLGLNHVPLLLSTLDPRKWQVHWGFDAQTYEIRAIRIMHFEIMLPPETLTEDVLWKVNMLRSALLESLTPWGISGSSDAGGWLWVGNAAQEMRALLEDIWPVPDLVQPRPKKLLWADACGSLVSDVLAPLQPVAEEMIPLVMDGGHHDAQGQKSRVGKAKRGREDGRRVGGSGGGPEALSPRKGLKPKEAKAASDAAAWLRKHAPHQEATMSALCGRFKTSPKTLAKYPDHFLVTALPGRNDELVRLAATGPLSRNSMDVKGRVWSTQPIAAHSPHSPPPFAARPSVDARIQELCRHEDIGCQVVDFDGRVKRYIREFERRRGAVNVDAAFQMLEEWCSKKERDKVRSWSSYLFVLLRNWEENEFEPLV